MSPEQYQSQREYLLEILADAEERGDYYLELDIREDLIKLRERYYGDE